jgi:hypothetical protein
VIGTKALSLTSSGWSYPVPLFHLLDDLIESKMAKNKVGCLLVGLAFVVRFVETHNILRGELHNEPWSLKTEKAMRKILFLKRPR